MYLALCGLRRERIGMGSRSQPQEQSRYYEGTRRLHTKLH